MVLLTGGGGVGELAGQRPAGAVEEHAGGQEDEADEHEQPGALDDAGEDREPLEVVKTASATAATAVVTHESRRVPRAATATATTR